MISRTQLILTITGIQCVAHRKPSNPVPARNHPGPSPTPLALDRPPAPQRAPSPLRIAILHRIPCHSLFLLPPSRTIGYRTPPAALARRAALSFQVPAPLVLPVRMALLHLVDRCHLTTVPSVLRRRLDPSGMIAPPLRVPPIRINNITMAPACLFRLVAAVGSPVVPLLPQLWRLLKPLFVKGTTAQHQP